MPLTIKQIESSKPKKKLYRISDNNGLCLEITPNGSKRWRLRYQFNRKAKMLSLGLYPEVNLKDARNLVFEMRQSLAKGLDPSQERQEQRAKVDGSYSFKAIADKWFAKKSLTLTNKKDRQTIYGRLVNHVFPFMADKSIFEITNKDMVAILERLEAMNLHETAKRVNLTCVHIFNYARVSNPELSNPASDTKALLIPASKRVKHFPAITKPSEIKKLLRKIKNFNGTFSVAQALKFIPYTFVRSRELRSAEWSEIDWEAREWQIPAHKMKAPRPHIVPLSTQVIDILKKTQLVTGHNKYVFHSDRSKEGILSENTINQALRRMGYSKDEMCCHGFRTTASTRLNEELKYMPDVIERQLAHGEANKVRDAYNRAEYLEERHKMMQEWADYLDGLAG
ncbi:tyrosine-type recombinase/integrase [Maridesulfovibrio hydrothermalis]|uniref:Putative phage integrase n=1 Tax=Maridesulfovibrio hydrothermalis AM13 = DSM 14728 TaxID=1121451 RepID=L0R5P1_9BACT|nr:integrase arm-type DNA-binding domain-containing protein [Maridesulfovibrio hydrothermalis]CCO21998.1 putative phage integrase [Maridesulfovibrio hydrothermalis AM13 = DSM 14728]